LSFRFQSPLPRGERHTRIACTRLTLKFQSALPRGERQKVGYL